MGNKGFDPFNCATSESVLKNYREAELKHGRLAMLAAAGWPVSELVQPWLSAALRAPDLLASGDKAPSLLNGLNFHSNPVPHPPCKHQRRHGSDGREGGPAAAPRCRRVL